MVRTVKGSRAELEREAAELIADKLGSLIAENGSAILGVPGGRSVNRIFALLKESDVAWEKVHLFMVDERIVPITHEDSNFRLAKEAFDGSPINMHPFTVEKGTDAYQAELASLGGRFDVVLLSSGEDGHVGALYPNHHSFDDESEGFITMVDSPKPPPERMTMSKRMLLKTGMAVLLFFGEGKREALARFKDESVKHYECPAKLIELIQESYAFTDQNG